MPAYTGHDLKLYYNSATHASPTWVEISQTEDVDVDQLEWDSAELARRASRIMLELPTLLRVGITFKLWHKIAATVYDVLRAAFFARTVMEFYVANGAAATAGTEGLRIGCFFKQFPWNQALRDVSSHNCRIVPTLFEESGSEVELDWYIISGS